MLLLMGKQLAVLLGEWVRRPLHNKLYACPAKVDDGGG
jgi:hypothetical protein